MTRSAQWLIPVLLAAPAAMRAQAVVIPDTMPARTLASRFAGARLMPSGVVSQFDSLGQMPMGGTGDSVTVYVFPDGDHLQRTLHARILNRRRFEPPASWRTACDEIAHPGWLFAVSPTSQAPFGVIVPGVHPPPLARPVPPASRDGAWQFFHAVADSAWTHYRDFLKPASPHALDYLHTDFWGGGDDAGWRAVKMFGVHGADGRAYTALSFAFRDDYPNTPTTARTWVVDAWGVPVAEINSDIDIYGTVDDHGGDAIVTSSGLIRWDGTHWEFPPVYSEEPCLYHQVMDPPANWHGK